MRNFKLLVTVAAWAATTATALPAQVPADAALPSSTGADHGTAQESATFRSLPPSDQKEIANDIVAIQRQVGCDLGLNEKDAGAAPVTAQEAGPGTVLTTEEAEVRASRMLLVDLGERELKKRQTLRTRDSLAAAEKLPPDCLDRAESAP